MLDLWQIDVGLKPGIFISEKNLYSSTLHAILYPTNMFHLFGPHLFMWKMGMIL